jgi:hypothetical protein
MDRDFLGVLVSALFIYSSACAAFCNRVAIAKNLNGTRWGFAGFIFGIIALIAVAGMPKRKPY